MAVGRWLFKPPSWRGGRRRRAGRARRVTAVAAVSPLAVHRVRVASRTSRGSSTRRTTARCWSCSRLVRLCAVVCARGRRHARASSRAWLLTSPLYPRALRLCQSTNTHKPFIIEKHGDKGQRWDQVGRLVSLSLSRGSRPRTARLPCVRGAVRREQGVQPNGSNPPAGARVPHRAARSFAPHASRVAPLACGASRRSLARSRLAPHALRRSPVAPCAARSLALHRYARTSSTPPTCRSRLHYS